MKTLNKTASKILDTLTQGLDKPGDHRKLDTAPDAFMSVSVECIWHNLYSVAHYYLQNGDLVPDPDIVFWRRPVDGGWIAVSLKNCFGISEGVRFTDGQPTHIRKSNQREIALFANKWMVNIKRQQDLSTIETPAAPAAPVAPAGTPAPNSCEMRQMDLF